jgi:hypothetical protein
MPVKRGVEEGRSPSARLFPLPFVNPDIVSKVIKSPLDTRQLAGGRKAGSPKGEEVEITKEKE